MVLVPFRSIAVDPTVVPLGTSLFIPDARGVTVTLPNGESVAHDGYFFAADRGGAIKGNHIDVFIGTSDVSPFPFIKSRSSATFDAYVVNDPKVTTQMKAVHGRR